MLVVMYDLKTLCRSDWRLRVYSPMLRGQQKLMRKSRVAGLKASAIWSHVVSEELATLDVKLAQLSRSLK